MKEAIKRVGAQSKNVVLFEVLFLKISSKRL